MSGVARYAAAQVVIWVAIVVGLYHAVHRWGFTYGGEWYISITLFGIFTMLFIVAPITAQLAADVGSGIGEAYRLLRTVIRKG